ncbi:MAG: hypothetical protein KGH64_00725 [Candidatus Micrarchaeota archaeon]|nr:hypothetical protein [Candidatus Micrarchaeota archaeon]
MKTEKEIRERIEMCQAKITQIKNSFKDPIKQDSKELQYWEGSLKSYQDVLEK